MKKTSLFLVFALSAATIFAQQQITKQPGKALPGLKKQPKTISISKQHSITGISKSSLKLKNLHEPGIKLSQAGQKSVKKNHSSQASAGVQAGQNSKLKNQNSKIKKCGTTEYMEWLKSQNPVLEQKMIKDEAKVQKWINNQSMNKQAQVIVTIPVVFHVVYNTGAENISDAQILSQIDVLNEDFRRLNADAVNTPSVFQSIAADAQIEFCLATKDPGGVATSGITRTSTSVTSFTTNDDVKLTSQGGENIWNRDKYLNIWVCDLGGGLGGYATFPGTASWRDGVVINYQTFGTIGTASWPYDEGRTGTHEVGHWFGLYHVWGGSGNNCTDSDLVGDTPNQLSEYFGCPSFPQNTCGSDDMFMNYMDYVNDACSNVFTQGQASRMNSFINSTRVSLKTSDGCEATGPPLADFIASATFVVNGTDITFTDLSTGVPATWSWDFGGGGTPNTSTAKNPVITFNSLGLFTVTLTVSNVFGSNIMTKTNYIEVVPLQGCGALLFSENFEGIVIPALPAGWTAYGQAGSDLFKTGNNGTASSTSFNPPAHTQFAFTNDDNCNCNKSADYLEMPSINLTGLSGYFLTFTSYSSNDATPIYQDTTYVQVSTDGGFIWNKIFTIPKIQSWTTYSVDLSAYDNMNDVRIRFFYADFGNWGYGFCVDDITINKQHGNELALDSISIWEYTLTPAAHAAPITFGGRVVNNGLNPQSGTVLNVDITGNGSFSGSSTPPVNIPFAASQNLTISTTYTPPWQGIYNVDFIVTQDSTDCVPGNNTLSNSFEVTDTVYARDDGTGSGSLWAGDSNDYIFGQTYQLQATDNLKSITCWVSGNVGAVMRLVVYNMAAGLPNTLLGASSNYTLTSGDMPSAILTLPINGGPLVLAAGTYFVALEAFNAPSDSLFGVYSDNIYTPNTTFASINGGAFNNLENLGGFQLAFVIRPNFVYTPYNNDLAINTVPYYSSIPESQVVPITFEGRVANNGANAQSNVVLNVNITGSGTFSGSSAALTSLASGADSLVTMTSSFTPSPGGSYKMDFTLTQTQAEEFPPDNSDSAFFVVSDSVYARDNGVYTGAGLWNGAGNSYEAGNVFEIINSQGAASVSVFLHAATTAGSAIKAFLYDGFLTPVDSSASYTIIQADIATGFITLPFLNIPTLAPDFYLAVIAQPNFGDTVAFATGSDIDQPLGTSFLRDTAGTGTWYLLFSTPFVRLNVVDACPTLALSPSSFICDGDTTTLTAAGGFTSYTWSPSASLSSPTGSSVNAFPAVTTPYTVIAAVAGCADDTGYVTVTINANPIVTVTPPGDTLCSGGSTMLIANGADNYFWSPSTGLDTNSGDTVIAAPVSTTTYTVTGIASNFCEDQDVVTVTVNATPAVPTAGTDATYCDVDTASAADLTATGTNIEWFDDIGLTNLVGTGSTFNPSLAVGTNNFYVTQTVSGCQSPYSLVVITVDNSPTISAAGLDQNICNATTTALAGNTATVGTGAWSVVSGTATITTPSSPTSGVTGLGIGFSAILRWTISNGVCTSSFDDVTITVDKLPTTSDAGLDTAICDTFTTLTANFPSVGTGAWSVFSGTAAITTLSLPTSGVTGLVLGASATLQWTISNGSCASSADTVVVTANPSPTIVTEDTTGETSCGTNDGTITITASGGTPPLQYSIDGGGNYSVSGFFDSLSTGSYPVVVSDANGCAVTGSTLIVSAPGAPSAPAAGTDTTYCDVDTAFAANLTATGTNIEWFDDLGLTNLIGTGSIYNPSLVAGTNTYYVTQTVAGCQSPFSTVVITVDGSPDIANAGLDQDICNLTTTTLAGNIPFVGTGTWSVTGTATVTSPSLPNSGVTGLVLDDSVTLSWTISNGICASSTDDVVINVYGLPTTSNAGLDQTLCDTTSTALTGNAPITGTGAWTVVTGAATITTPSSSTSTVTGLVAGTSVTLRWTISNGPCSSTDDVIITINPLPSTSAITGISSVCENEPGVVYSVTFSAGSAYNWTAPPGAVIASGQGANLITVNWDTTSGNIQVTETDVNGCTGNSVSMAVTVNTLAPASVSITSTTNTICAGDNLTFTATPTNEGGTPAYQWQVNGGNVGTNSPTYATTNLTNGDAVTCIMTSSLSCVTGSPATSNAVIITVTPSLPASVLISASPNPPICAGDNVIFTATQTNGGTPTYQWQVNGVNVGTDSSYSSSALNNGDSVTCIMTSTLTCATGSPATSNVVVMAVNPLPTPSISQQFDSVLTVDTTYSSYQWLFNDDTIIIGATSQVYIASQTGLYAVWVTDANGCSGKSAQTPVIISGISDLELLSNLKIYPNPANDVLIIDANNIRLNMITMINSLGQVVIVNKPNNNNTHELDVSGLAPGLYFLQIQTNKGMVMKNVGISK
ncbi:MAG: PKD domain-containing protein [Cytophagales bacterium]|nr:PKD domain-containing protein [Cytophagales bacterium]